MPDKLVKHRYNKRSGFQPGHPFYRSNKPNAYVAPRPPSKDRYEQVASVPDNLRWKPAPWGSRPRVPGSRREKLPPNSHTVMFSLGNEYKLVRTRATGEVVYYRLKDIEQKSPAEKIDTEPAKPEQVRYRVGCFCWFVDSDSRWYCCEVVERTGGDRATAGDAHRITLRPVTGWDAERVKEWPYGDLLEFPSLPANPLFQRLRPLKARTR